MKDYHVEIKVRNNRLLKRIRDRGYESAAKFARDHNLSLMTLYDYLSFRLAPIDAYGNLRRQTLLLCDVLNCLPEDIFPPQHLTATLKKNKASFEATAADIAGYLPGHESAAQPAIDSLVEQENIQIIDDVLKTLPSRYEQVIRRRFGLGSDPQEQTCREIAPDFGVTQTRINAIEKAAFRLLRATAKRDERLREIVQATGAQRGSFWGNSMPDRHYIPEWKRKELAEQAEKEEQNEA